MRRKEVEEELASLNVKIEPKLLKDLEFVWRDRQYRTRSAFIVDAIKSHVNGKLCPYCGTVNPNGAILCALCLHPMEENSPIDVKVSIVIDEKKIKPKRANTQENAAKNRGWDK